MIPYEEWEIIKERENIEVRKDPYEPEGHGICIKDTGKIILFPRSTLQDLAQIKNTETGRAIIENLLPITEKRGRFFEGSNINYGDIMEIARDIYRNF